MFPMAKFTEPRDQLIAQGRNQIIQRNGHTQDKYQLRQFIQLCKHDIKAKYTEGEGLKLKYVYLGVPRMEDMSI